VDTLAVRATGAVPRERTLAASFFRKKRDASRDHYFSGYRATAHQSLTGAATHSPRLGGRLVASHSEKGTTMTFVLIVLFAVDYGSVGNPVSGRAGPASVSIPGYSSAATCSAAGRAVKEQVGDPTLKKRTLFFCIPGPPASGPV
jgi:hypothetical protein